MARITVRESQWAAVRLDGRIVTVLGPGRHRLPRRRWGHVREVRVVDARRFVIVVAGQELSCADVPGVRATAAVTYQVSDPAAFLDVAADPLEIVRVAAQIALRDAVAARTLEALTSDRAVLAAEMLEAVAATATTVGVRVLHADLRDVSPPGEVRRAMLAVHTARQEGQAALERARGETAALRALANGGQVLRDNPGLLQLRTAQVAAASGGTVVLGQALAVSAAAMPR